MEPVIPLAKAPDRRKPGSPASSYTGFDRTAVIAGSVAIGATQLRSGSHPEIASKVSRNILGPDMALGKGRVGLTSPSFVSGFFLPQPAGFLDPNVFGLEPNYVERRYNTRARAINRQYGPIYPVLPESAILKTQRDNDPAVLAATYHANAVQQRRALYRLAAESTDAELVRLHDHIRTAEGRAQLYEPDDATLQVEIAIRSRAREAVPGEATHGAGEFLARHRARLYSEILPGGDGLATGAPSPVSRHERAPFTGRVPATATEGLSARYGYREEREQQTGSRSPATEIATAPSPSQLVGRKNHRDPLSLHKRRAAHVQGARAQLPPARYPVVRGERVP